jgi:4-diphosphocytidyl-2-C-methyl-D-erythritol kinase
VAELQLQSPCKINLLLNILGRRPDGFHELETVLQPLRLGDELVFVRQTKDVVLTCSQPELPVDSSNLVVRAATAFFSHAGITDGVRIHLEKKVPLAAGLGGGSSNAALTLKGLNKLFGQPLTDQDLYPLAARLGSDVPFFLQEQPALATGRGEIIQPLAPMPALTGHQVLLLHPGFGVSTAWAYQHLANYPQALNGQPGRAQQLIDKLQQPDLRQASSCFYNSLEAPVLAKYPLLRLFQEFFLDQGAEVSLMSGSGSTTFALFAHRSAAEQADEKVKKNFGLTTWTAISSL